MRFLHHLSLAAVVVSASATPASATVLCEYAAFTPSAFQHYVTSSLAGLGVAVVPARYFTDRADPSELAVVSNSRLYGHMRLDSSLAGAKTSLIIENARGTQLGQAESDTFACSGGWCRTSDLTTKLDDDTTSIYSSALRISQSPRYRLGYQVYGQDVGSGSWRDQFEDRVDWTVAALSDDDSAVILPAFTPPQTLYLALATEPTVAPYVGTLNITTDRQNRLVVRGRVPQLIYDLIIGAALRAGFYNIVPDIIIDSAAYIVPVSADPDLQRCFGW